MPYIGESPQRSAPHAAPCRAWKLCSWRIIGKARNRTLLTMCWKIAHAVVWKIHVSNGDAHTENRNVVNNAMPLHAEEQRIPMQRSGESPQPVTCRSVENRSCRSAENPRVLWKIRTERNKEDGTLKTMPCRRLENRPYAQAEQC